MDTELARDFLRLSCITALAIVAILLTGCRSAADSRPQVEIAGRDNHVTITITTERVESAQGKTVSPELANESGPGDGGLDLTFPLVP